MPIESIIPAILGNVSVACNALNIPKRINTYTRRAVSATKPDIRYIPSIKSTINESPIVNAITDLSLES